MVWTGRNTYVRLYNYVTYTAVSPSQLLPMRKCLGALVCCLSTLFVCLFVCLSLFVCHRDCWLHLELPELCYEHFYGLRSQLLHCLTAAAVQALLCKVCLAFQDVLLH